jgi:hypothetical protein
VNDRVHQVNVRVSPVAVELFKEIGRRWGLNQGGTFETLVRREAERIPAIFEAVQHRLALAPPVPLPPSTPLLPGPLEAAVFGLPTALEGLPVVLPDAPRRSLVSSVSPTSDLEGAHVEHHGPVQDFRSRAALR